MKKRFLQIMNNKVEKLMNNKIEKFMNNKVERLMSNKFGKFLRLCLIGVTFTSGAFLCGFERNAQGIPEALVINNSPTIIVGDSRMVNVHDAVGDAGCDWMATAGSTYNKLVEYSKIIDGMELKGKRIVISYGINDINTPEPSLNSFFKYQNFMNTKALEWVNRGAKVYFTDIPGVTPVIRTLPGCENTAVDLINEYVRQFNDLTVTGGFPSQIKHINLNIPASQYVDGLHYNEAACVYVFNRMMSE